MQQAVLEGGTTNDRIEIEGQPTALLCIGIMPVSLFIYIISAVCSSCDGTASLSTLL
jgi:hypothetical protein